MKTKVVITYETDIEKDSDDILTQIGLLLIVNSKKIKEYEIKHKQDK